MNNQQREESEFQYGLRSWMQREQGALQYRKRDASITVAMTEEQRLHNVRAQNELYAAMERGER